MQASIAGLRTPLAAARPALAARRAVVCSASKDTKRSEVQLNASLAPGERGLQALAQCMVVIRATPPPKGLAEASAAGAGALAG